MTNKSILGQFRDLDNFLFTITGKRVKDLLPKAIEVFGSEASERVLNEAKEILNKESPYKILGLRPDADDFVIDVVHRNLVKRYHPDNPTSGNEEIFKQVQGAYEKIKELRGN